MNNIRILLASIPLLLAACAGVQKPDAGGPTPQVAAAPSASMASGPSMMAAKGDGKSQPSACSCMKMMSGGMQSPTAPKPDPGGAAPKDDEHKDHHPEGKK